MQYILSLLPLLACPVGMGLMMWFMMRGNKQEQAPQRTDQLPTTSAYQTPVEATHESPRRNSPLQMLFMCLNWRVVAGLAVVGVIVWAVAPQLLLGAIPLLIVAACPLSMLFDHLRGGVCGPRGHEVKRSQAVARRRALPGDIR